MFTFKIGSVNPKPDVLNGEGVWLANNTDVGWGWFDTENYWSKEMTFSATISIKGTSDIDLSVIASKENDDNIDEIYGSIQVTGEDDTARQKFKSFFRNTLYFFKELFSGYISHRSHLLSHQLYS